MVLSLDASSGVGEERVGGVNLRGGGGSRGLLKGPLVPLIPAGVNKSSAEVRCWLGGKEWGGGEGGCE